MRMTIGILALVLSLGQGRAAEIAPAAAGGVAAPVDSAETPSASAAAFAVPPPIVAPLPPTAAPLLTLSAADQDAIDKARDLRGAGITLFGLGLPLTLASQLLLGVALVEELPLGDAVADSLRFKHTQVLMISSIITTVVGNALIAAGLGLWGTGNAQLRQHRKSLSVGALTVAPTADSHGGQGGLVVHF